MAATLARNKDAAPDQPTRSANTVAGIRGVPASNRRTSFSNTSNEDPAGLRSYFGAVSAANARSTVPRETPNCFASSRLEIFSFAKRWRIVTQSSKLITFNDVRWPHFQLALVALFSVGVDTELADTQGALSHPDHEGRRTGPSPISETGNRLTGT